MTNMTGQQNDNIFKLLKSKYLNVRFTIDFSVVIFRLTPEMKRIFYLMCLRIFHDMSFIYLILNKAKLKNHFIKITEHT